MKHLPITHLTLYKHGVGYFEREGRVTNEAVSLTFRAEEINDVLKSLTAIPRNGGHVLGVDYATPQTDDELLAGNSIQLGDRRSFRDLLLSLRGRRVHLLLDQEEFMTGTLLGLDELPAEQPLSDALVSLLVDGVTLGKEAAEETRDGRVRAVRLGRLQGIDLLEDEAAGDLRFFLETALRKDDYRRVTVRLSPDVEELALSYVAPAPTWRVSYRLIADPEAEMALLLGWGIFDNRLEEDLQGISLSLVAGMPISFVYDLVTPFTPERPKVEEEGRVAAGPIDFAGAVREREEGAPMEASRAMPAAPAAMAAVAPASDQRRKHAFREAVREAAPVAAEGKVLGELFQYNVQMPVTVGRGRSAMVPILSVDLKYRKDMLYNGRKLATHPVASLRLHNRSGLTLERGPVTVVEEGEYVGEAILPFTADDSELVIPYAVELSVRVRENRGNRREVHALHVRGAYLVVEEWDIRWFDYQINNEGGEEREVIVEHPRPGEYDLFETQAPLEKTDEHWRFQVGVPAGTERSLRVQIRRLTSRREELQRQSYERLGHYFKQGMLDGRTRDEITSLLELWESIGQKEKRLQEIEAERGKIYRAQEQVQGNMQALATTGKEGALRARYVDQLASSEMELQQLAKEEMEVKEQIRRLRDEVAQRLEALS